MALRIKIQSITDLITNSSSETYMYLQGDAIDNVKNIINSILNLAGNGFTWEDFFKIEESFDHEDAEDLFFDEYNRKPESEEELIDFVHKYNDDGGCGHGFIDTWFEISSTDKDSVKAASILNKLNNLFHFEEYENY